MTTSSQPESFNRLTFRVPREQRDIFLAGVAFMVDTQGIAAEMIAETGCNIAPLPELVGLPTPRVDWYPNKHADSAIPILKPDTLSVFESQYVKLIGSKTRASLALIRSIKQGPLYDVSDQFESYVVYPDGSGPIAQRAVLRADRITEFADALNSHRLKLREVGQKTIEFMWAVGKAIEPADLVPPANR